MGRTLGEKARKTLEKAADTRKDILLSNSLFNM